VTTQCGRHASLGRPAWGVGDGDGDGDGDARRRWKQNTRKVIEPTVAVGLGELNQRRLPTARSPSLRVLALPVIAADARGF